PTVTFLNHGSFGACPNPVLDAQTALRAAMEAQPVDFLWRRLKDLQRQARARVAAFLNADPDGLAFVPNATTGTATVLHGLDLRPGDQILLTDHAYPAVSKAVSRACHRTGAEMVVLPIPLPLPGSEEIADAFSAAVSDR